MASGLVVLNRRFQGQAGNERLHRVGDVLAGIHCRAPISACPALSRTYDRGQDRAHGEVPFLVERSFSARPSSEPRGHLSVHVALQ